MNKEIREFIENMSILPHKMSDKQLIEFEKQLIEYKEIVEKLNKTHSHLYSKITHMLKGIKFEKSFRKL